MEHMSTHIPMHALTQLWKSLCGDVVALVYGDGLPQASRNVQSLEQILFYSNIMNSNTNQMFRVCLEESRLFAEVNRCRGDWGRHIRCDCHGKEVVDHPLLDT